MHVCGTILFCENFTFNDGVTKDKYVVVLNTPCKSDPHIIVPTTSQDYCNKTKQPGCQKPYNIGYYFIPANKTFFPRDTWIILNCFQMIDDIEKKYKSEKKGELPQAHTKGIIDCLLFHYKDDIPYMYQDLLNPSVQTLTDQLHGKWRGM